MFANLKITIAQEIYDLECIQKAISCGQDYVVSGRIVSELVARHGVKKADKIGRIAQRFGIIEKIGTSYKFNSLSKHIGG